MTNKIAGWILFLSVLSIYSCTSSRKYDYFQQGKKDKEKSAEFPFPVKLPPPHIIDVNDVIEINYYTPDEINQSIISSTDEGEKKAKVNIYQVNSDGKIDIPLIGGVVVKGLTVPEMQDTVSKRLSGFFNIAYIHARLFSFNINIIGEVNRPGILTVNSDQVNIIQAISMAGELTQYGNKKSIVLVRKTNDKYTMHEFDLTNLNIVASDLYFLKSNDILYVKPLRSKNAMVIFPYVSIGLTMLNTILIITQLFR